MKKITLVLFGILIGFHSSSQTPNPELFDTWYLYKIEIKFSNGLLISEVDPPISPWLTINKSLEFNGFGACNEFWGNFEYIPATDRLDPINYDETLLDCETEFHDAIEDEYFGYFKWPGSLYYYFYTDTDGLVHLLLSKGSPGFELNFVNEQLSLTNFSNTEIKIFPNPVSKKLYLISENHLIDNIVIYSATGKKVLEAIKFENSIDVSTLSKGMYFLEIESTEGRSVRKFIKN